MSTYRANLKYVIFDLENSPWFKVRYLSERLLRKFGWFKNSYLLHEDYILKTKDYSWKVKAHSDFDHSVRPTFEIDLIPYFHCDGLFIDVGANIGKWSVIVAKKSASVMVLSFEPNPMAFEYLNTNIRLNGLSNVRPINKVVSSHNGIVTFSAEPTLTALSAVAGDMSDAKNCIDVEATTLDAFLGDRALPQDVLVKVDVEGHEFEVFKGAKGLFTHLKSGDRVICEILDSQTRKQEIMDFMQGLDFGYQQLGMQFDYLFTKK